MVYSEIRAPPQKLRRPLRPDNWITFDKYSHLVKHVDQALRRWSTGNPVYVHCLIPLETYQGLLDSRRGTFLPCLEDLQWPQVLVDHQSATFLHFHMFLGPALRHLGFSVDGENVPVPALVTIFSGIETKCPLLETIGMRINNTLFPALSASLCSHLSGCRAL